MKDTEKFRAPELNTEMSYPKFKTSGFLEFQDTTDLLKHDVVLIPFEFDLEADFKFKESSNVREWPLISSEYKGFQIYMEDCQFF
jgi:hypothetical protein